MARSVIADSYGQFVEVGLQLPGLMELHQKGSGFDDSIRDHFRIGIVEQRRVLISQAQGR